MGDDTQYSSLQGAGVGGQGKGARHRTVPPGGEPSSSSTGAARDQRQMNVVAGTMVTTHTGGTKSSNSRDRLLQSKSSFSVVSINPYTAYI